MLLLLPARRLGQILLRAKLHDSCHQRKRKRLVERKFQVSFRSRVLCRGGLTLRVAAGRGQQSNMLLEGREVDQKSVQREGGHPITNEFVALRRRRSFNRRSQFP